LTPSVPRPMVMPRRKAKPMASTAMRMMEGMEALLTSSCGRSGMSRIGWCVGTVLGKSADAGDYPWASSCLLLCHSTPNAATWRERHGVMPGCLTCLAFDSCFVLPEPSGAYGGLPGSKRWSPWC
jgi:hypothetical protein